MTQENLPVFTRDWFGMNIPKWRETLKHLAGQPNLNFLEIGVMEGRATHWLLTNILTHPTSRIVCIDTFKGSMENHSGIPNLSIEVVDLYDAFKKNISMFVDRVEILKGFSQELLRNQPLNVYDFIYIDGSHKSADVLEDAVLSFRLLRSGGLMIFDDYEWFLFRGTLDNPRIGIDAFLNVFEGQYELVSKNYQVTLRKC